ncbi:MarR family winged helix-turn-helix transcriptional regulator [Variovorax sp. PAMC 28711]|uniref:MarR family winged helix-turn-helix transcriptional regulator n=1 Tax=Variovorax sp. PAMC 28711 TaxID=1795631 RepID=UPI00078B72B8|nr:MarR family winged helix-turn-helix transcriptional regulator [Variovorax sp. PAMC 28711]AMM26897.1 MarR family transcriptional regulator [Variovorax sp. PAMC 28711]
MPTFHDTTEKQRFEALSDFRFRLRSFLRFSEDAARDEGITVLQYQLMLHTQGFPGRPWATIGEIAERLQAQPHGVVALASRCEEAGLVRRKTSASDRRQVEVHLLAAGRKKLARLAIQHADQLSELAEAVRLATEIQEEGSSLRPALSSSVTCSRRGSP